MISLRCRADTETLDPTFFLSIKCCFPTVFSIFSLLFALADDSEKSVRSTDVAQFTTLKVYSKSVVRSKLNEFFIRSEKR